MFVYICLVPHTEHRLTVSVRKIQTCLTSEESVPIHSLLSYLKLAEMLDSLLVTREIKNAGEILKQNPETEY